MLSRGTGVGPPGGMRAAIAILSYADPIPDTAQASPPLGGPPSSASSPTSPPCDVAGAALAGSLGELRLRRERSARPAPERPAGALGDPARPPESGRAALRPDAAGTRRA